MSIEDDDFISSIKIVERTVFDNKSTSATLDCPKLGFPSVTHRSKSKLVFSRSGATTNAPVPCNFSKECSDFSNILGDVKTISLKLSPGEINKLEWTNPLGLEADSKEISFLHQIRFDFDGKVIVNSDEIPVRSGLYNHGDEPNRAGYTISELIWLCQSNMPSQVNIALRTLRNILRNPPVNTTISNVKVTQYRWNSYIYNDVAIVNILANLIERSLNESNTGLLLDILALVLYGDNGGILPAIDLFHSLYPQFRRYNDIFFRKNVKFDQNYLINESDILDYLYKHIQKKRLICLQTLVGLVFNLNESSVKIFLNHKIFDFISDVANFKDCHVRHYVIKLYRILYLFGNENTAALIRSCILAHSKAFIANLHLNPQCSSKSSEGGYPEEQEGDTLKSELGKDFETFEGYPEERLRDTLKSKWYLEIVEFLGLLSLILDIKLAESFSLQDLFSNALKVYLSDIEICLILTHFYMLGTSLIINGHSSDFIDLLTDSVPAIYYKLNFSVHKHIRLANAIVLFAKHANLDFSFEGVKDGIYRYLDRYDESSPYELLDIVFYNNSLAETIFEYSNSELINLLYAVNILSHLEGVAFDHEIFSIISASLNKLIRTRTQFDCNWNAIEKAEYKFHLLRPLSLFHCFSKFLDLALSQFTSITKNGVDVYNYNQLMEIISLHGISRLEKNDAIKTLELLIDKSKVYKQHLTCRFFATELITIYSNIPKDSKLVDLLDDFDFSEKLAKVAEIYLYDKESVFKQTDLLRFDIEHLLEIYKNGAIVSNVSTLVVLVCLYTMDGSIVESIWKDSEVMAQISKSLDITKSEDGHECFCLDGAVLGKVKDYVREDLLYLYRDYAPSGDNGGHLRGSIGAAGMIDLKIGEKGRKKLQNGRYVGNKGLKMY